MASRIETLERRLLLAQFTLDTSFGVGGYGPVSAGALLNALPDGKLLVGHRTVHPNSNGDVDYLRLNADGSVDTSFNDTGDPADSLSDTLAVVTGNRLIVAGQLTNEDMYVRAIDLDDGSPDTTFSGDGIIRFTPGRFSNTSGQFSFQFTDMAISNDGSILIGLEQQIVTGINEAETGHVICKLRSAGGLDTSFGDAGTLTVETPNYVYLAAGPGATYYMHDAESTLSRHHADNGSLDTTFGSGDGKVTAGGEELLPVPGSDKLIVTYGHVEEDGSGSYFISRLNADGTTDTSFAGDGSVSFDGFSSSRMTFDPQGRLVGSGLGTSDVFRLTANGDLDTTFGGDGTIDIDEINNFHPIAVDSAGRIVIGGTENHTIFRLIERDTEVSLRGNGRIYVDGTGDRENVRVTRNGNDILVEYKGGSQTFPVERVNGLIIRTFGGDDTVVNGTELPSTLDGGTGDDRLAGSFAVDRIYGDSGNDNITGGDAGDKLYGDVGIDSIFGNGGSDYIEGGVNSDHIRGNAGRDRILGGGGNDKIYGGPSGDWLYGGRGADRLYGEGGLDRLYADDNDSARDLLSGGAGDDILVSDDGFIDDLFGDRDRDTAFVDANDILTGIEVTS